VIYGAGRRGHDGRVVTIVIAGPQATGKTTLALALGRELCIPVFSRDPVIAALLGGRPRWVRRWLGGRAAAAGLRVQTALLSRQLAQGQSAIIECVAPLTVRAEWRQLTTAAGGRYVGVECVCPDPVIHRARLAARANSKGLPGGDLGWRQVQTTMRLYQADPAADFVADARRPVDELVAEIASMTSPERPGR
jgi:predicted kinase